MSIGNIKDYTPNYKFIIPKFDTATWHDYIESNFRSIDALLYNIFVVNGYKGEWTNSTLYEVGSVVFIGDDNGDFTGKLFKVLVEHTTPNDGNFETFYKNNPDKYEQFADFDAAEKAAQLAKDWANKISGTVDGLEYSAKYYAQLAQQTVNSKANDNEVVHKTGNETITGTKTFTDYMITDDILPKGNITLGTSTNTWGMMVNFQDTTGKRIARIQPMAIDTTNNRVGMWVNNADNSVEKGIYIDSDGTTSAPTPSASDNSTKIATTAFVKVQGYAVDSNVVHKTDYEIITGHKVFKTQIDFISTNMTQGDNNSGYGIQFLDKNSNRFGFLRPRAQTSANVLELCATKVVNGEIKFSGIDSIVDSNGNCYVKATASDINGSIVTTINKSKAANGYFQLGNGLIIQWGGVLFNNQIATITFPKAFTNAESWKIVAMRDAGATATNDGGQIYRRGGGTSTGCSLYATTLGIGACIWIAIGY